MRGNGFRRWRPIVGVVALGVFAFGWSLTGAAKEEHSKVPTDQDATTDVVVETASAGEADSSDAGGLADVSPVLAYDVDSHMATIVSRFPVDGRVTYAEAYGGAFGGLRQEECLCDLDCADGDPCTEDLCGAGDICTHGTAGAVDRPCDDQNLDGLFCTTGLCDTLGNCLEAAGGPEDVCGAGYVLCGSVPCCDETNDICDECNVNGDCDDGQWCNGPEQCISNECEFGDDPCPDQACDEDNDMCTGEHFDGRCCEDLDDDGVFETCNITSYSACQTAGGLWSMFPGTCDCPKFSAGWGPPGDFWNVGMITEQPCERYTRLGDDYTLANGSYITLEEFMFVGGVDCTGDGTVVFEFWDSVTEPPTLVDYMTIGFTCPDDQGANMWMITPGTPFVIPPTGYVTYRPGIGSGETAMWWLTDVVDIGGNNVNLLWYNNNRTSLWSDEGLADILSFQLKGTKIAPPIGACCSADGLQCVETVEWLCVDTEEPPMGWNFVPGGTCPDSCDVGACCIIGGDDAGDCIENVLSQTACEAMPGGGEWQGYGTDCDPNCCLQPFTGGDDCDLAYVHEIVVPPATTPPTYVTVTISGDTTPATQGLCYGENYSGWFEAFKLVESPGGPDAECAEVWIDKCCTSETWSPSYFVVYDGCNEAAGECGDAVYADDYAYQQYCGGDDGNFYLHFDALAGGTYHYDVLHPPDAPVGGGPYQMHIRVGACSDNACCTVSGQCTVGGGTAQCPDDGIGCLPCLDDTDCPAGETCWRICTTSEGQPGGAPCTFSFQCANAPVNCPTCRCLMGECWAPCSDETDCPTGGDTCDDYGSCSVLNPIECREFDGIAPENTATCFQTCDLGACCTGPGVCVDNSGAGMTLNECRALGSDEWYPSLRCDDDPCAVCPFEGAQHCQYDYAGGTGNYIVTIDYSLPMLSRWADDFTPTSSGPLERLCWIACFRIDSTGAGCQDAPPADDWEVRFYEDNAGLPGAEIPPIGGQDIVVDVAGDTIPGTVCAWRTAPITQPPTVQADECYWVEIMGTGNGVGGCNFFWRTAGDGNGYALNDGNGVWGPEDVVLQISGDNNVDMTFCVDVGMVPNEGCGPIPGACCTATDCVQGDNNVCYSTGECSGLNGQLCDPNVIPTTCPTGETCIPGVFYPAETCPDPCTGPPANDWCENAFDVTAAGQPCEGGAPCTFPTTNVLASQDVAGNTAGCVVDGSLPRCNEGGALAAMNFGADVWYEYHTGPLECGIMTASMCGVGGYDGCIAVYDGCDCYPPDDPIACGDDTCGTGGDVACAKVPGIKNNKCYLIRVGGWAGAFGSSQVEVTMALEECAGAKRPDPVGFAPDMWTNPPGDPSCMEDSDCRPTTLAITPYCIPQEDGSYPGTCYAPTNRYLSIARNPDQSSATGRRITLSTGAAGPWWVGAPSYNAPEDTYFASVQDTPVFAGMGPGTWVDGDWPDEIHVKGCEIAPGTHTYLVQAVQSGGEGDEANYSPPLDLRVQVRWADVVSSCFNNECLPPSGTFTEPSIDDVLAEVNAFQGIRNAPLWWMDIDPVFADGEPEGLWTLIGDVLQTVNAFTGQSYPGWGPATCP